MLRMTGEKYFTALKDFYETQPEYSYDESVSASIEYFDGDDLAGQKFVDKYALRKPNGMYTEKTPDDMHHRLAWEFFRIEAKKFKEPMSYEKIYNLLKGFKYIVPQGSPMYGIGNPYSYITISNCFVIDSPEDSISGIMKTDQELAQIFKRRGGCGVSIESLRPRDMPTNNAAKTSTGSISFAERFSNTTREIGQNSRRGASLESTSIHHPDIMEFITVKNDLTRLTGANISVKLTDEFLNAVSRNEDYEIRFPVDSNTPIMSEMISASNTWDTICENAWKMAEPGILFWDNMIRESPADCYENFKTISTNPCCFAKSENIQVITKSGYKELKEVTSDDLVWVDNTNNTSGWMKTSGYFDAGVAQTYIIELSNGISFKVTGNHKFRRIVDNTDTMVELNDFSVGDNIAVIQSDPLSELGDSVGGTSEIISISKSDICEVGCIEVPEYNTFIANGVISGNSEIPLSPYDSCRLIIQNLYSYVTNPFTKSAKFDYELYGEHAQLTQRFMDNMVDIEFEMVNRIISKIEADPENKEIKSTELNLWKKIREMCKLGRRTGTGITALGDAIAACGIKYDSNKGISMTGNIYRTLKLNAYRSSVDMAKELGAFPVWDYDLEKNNPFLLRIKDEDPKLYRDMKKYGRRNIALLTTAPTGTVSMMTQTSGGIEPEFSIDTYTRRVKGNPGDEKFRSDFVDDNGDHWMEFEVIKPKLKTWMAITGETDITKSPWYGSCAPDLDWKKRVGIQAAAQSEVCHSISSCLAVGESTILTTSGMLDIEEFTCGEEKEFLDIENDVFSVNIENNKAKITSVFNNGLSNTIKFDIGRGRSIRCTQNHKLAILNEEYNMEWKMAKDITLNDIIVGRKGLNIWSKDSQHFSKVIGKEFNYKKLSNSKNVKKLNRMSIDMGTLIGYLMSDGSVASLYSIYSIPSYRQ